MIISGPHRWDGLGQYPTGRRTGRTARPLLAPQDEQANEAKLGIANRWQNQQRSQQQGQQSEGVIAGHHCSAAGEYAFCWAPCSPASNLRSCRARSTNGPECSSYGNKSRRGVAPAAVPGSPRKPSRTADRKNGRSAEYRCSFSNDALIRQFFSGEICSSQPGAACRRWGWSPSTARAAMLPNDELDLDHCLREWDRRRGRSRDAPAAPCRPRLHHGERGRPDPTANWLRAFHGQTPAAPKAPRPPRGRAMRAARRMCPRVKLKFVPDA